MEDSSPEPARPRERPRLPRNSRICVVAMPKTIVAIVYHFVGSIRKGRVCSWNQWRVWLMSACKWCDWRSVPDTNMLCPGMASVNHLSDLGGGGGNPLPIGAWQLGFSCSEFPEVHTWTLSSLFCRTNSMSMNITVNYHDSINNFIVPTIKDTCPYYAYHQTGFQSEMQQRRNYEAAAPSIYWGHHPDGTGNGRKTFSTLVSNI